MVGLIQLMNEEVEHSDDTLGPSAHIDCLLDQEFFLFSEKFCWLQYLYLDPVKCLHLVLVYDLPPYVAILILSGAIFCV